MVNPNRELDMNHQDSITDFFNHTVIRISAVLWWVTIIVIKFLEPKAPLPHWAVVLNVVLIISLILSVAVAAIMERSMIKTFNENAPVWQGFLRILLVCCFLPLLVGWGLAYSLFLAVCLPFTIGSSVIKAMDPCLHEESFVPCSVEYVKKAFSEAKYIRLVDARVDCTNSCNVALRNFFPKGEWLEIEVASDDRFANCVIISKKETKEGRDVVSSKALELFSETYFGCYEKAIAAKLWEWDGAAKFLCNGKSQRLEWCDSLFIFFKYADAQFELSYKIY